MQLADAEFWIPAILASSLVGLSKGGLPVVGMLATPILALFISPVTATGLLLPVFVASDVFGLWAYRRAYDKRVLAILMPASTVGVLLGWATAAIVSDRLVTALVGTIGLSFALSLLARRDESRGAPRPAVVKGAFWGAVTGFTSFVSHAGAPPFQVYVLPLKLEKSIYVGTTTILFAYVNAIKLLPYWALGQFSAANLKTAALLAVPGILSVFVGVKAVKIVPQQTFFRIVTWSLLLVSIKLLWDAAQPSPV